MKNKSIILIILIITISLLQNFETKKCNKNNHTCSKKSENCSEKKCCSNNKCKKN